MPRPIWKGSISFGLVNVPVVLYGGESRESELHFNLLDSSNMARVRNRRVNEVTGEEVPWDRIVKGYEVESGSYVVLDDEDFRRADVEATKTVEIEDFVERDAVPYVYFDKPYYLVPDSRGDKGYVLLRETLRSTGKVGIARVVIRTRQYLAAVLPEGDAIVLGLLRFKDELRDPSEFDLPRGELAEYRINKRELEMAERLVESMSGEWEPEKYRDDYREALQEWIRKKAAAGGVMLPEPEEAAAEPTGAVIDMMDLLQRSLEERGGRQRVAAASKASTRKRDKPDKAAAKKTGKAAGGRAKKASGRRRASGE